MPGRPGQVREEAEYPARCAVQRPLYFPEILGTRRRRRLAELEEVLAGHVVRRAPLLQVAGDQGVQDAHPRAALEVPGLYGVRQLRRHAAEAGLHAVED